MGDPEIDAMSSVATTLANLDEDAQGRVIRWAAARYGIALGKQDGRSGGAVSDDTDDDVTEEEIAAEAPSYEYFAELFAAAQPKTNEDKALVAAYWVQVLQEQGQWASRLLNAELKHLGHSIPNITDALTSNIKKKPQRVIQLKKSGSSQQANKVYKVTNEGIVYVQGMMGHGG